MKNRKIVVIAFTLIAVLLLGVGYAAVTDDLKILGHVKTNMETITSDFQLDVRFKDGSGIIIIITIPITKKATNISIFFLIFKLLSFNN